MRRVFADFDGTWTDHPEIWGQVDAIITGESWQAYDEFMQEWVGPKKPIFFNPANIKELSLLTIVNHKANIINKCKVTKFFENVPEQVQMLRIICPETDIVLVKPEMNFI